MPIGLTLRIEQDDINALIRKAARYEARKVRAVNALIERYTILIYKEAIRNVPVDTGNLRDSIYTVLEDTAMGVLFGEVTTDSTTYAIFVEFGTVYMAARPYMRGAYLRYVESFILELNAIFVTL